jgi:predicted alpha/beta hydrolase family esterase
MTTTLIVPGLGGSEPSHWQSWLESQVPNARRVVQADWLEPDLPRWSAKLRNELTKIPGRVFIVAHSFGCLAAASAAFDCRELISGVMLVAPADPERFGLARIVPAQSLGVPAVVVASENDPWMGFHRARHWARSWDAEFISLGAAGHVNVASGHGPWPKGLAILRSIQRQSGAAHDNRTARNVA